MDSVDKPWVDIVDKNDCVIGQTTRDDAHARYLRHRFIQVLVVNQGNILLQQRSKLKEKGPLLLDSSVGGHVDVGETYDEAVRREGNEELGLPYDSVYTLLGRIEDSNTPVENMTGMLYLCETDGPFTGWEREAELLFWVSSDELSTLIRFPFLFTGGMLSSAELYLQIL
jgi:isopentenyldiphosphate isomerase